MRRCRVYATSEVVSGLSGVQDLEAIVPRRIARDDLDRRPGPLPDGAAGRTREPDPPAGALDRYARPAAGDARRPGPVGAHQLGDGRDRVVALEGDEAGRLAQPLFEGGLDARAERGEAVRPVAQERDAGAVGAQRRPPSGELRLPGRRTDEDVREAVVAARSEPLPPPPAPREVSTLDPELEIDEFDLGP